ncbi:hypothetical protein E2C01_011371 [Portunus trituberculatus]|uniref:Uncharacterized protein n=1 Tax=Portunus trituberculatus TaxID=210409 RepID=A0A5B7DBI6_PORTR|nr:hypothetical protein [Portunus trituberculatus]
MKRTTNSALDTSWPRLARVLEEISGAQGPVTEDRGFHTSWDHAARKIRRREDDDKLAPRPDSLPDPRLRINQEAYGLC